MIETTTTTKCRIIDHCVSTRVQRSVSFPSDADTHLHNSGMYSILIAVSPVQFIDVQRWRICGSEKAYRWS